MYDENPRENWLDLALRCLADGTRRRLLVELRSAEEGIGLRQEALASRLSVASAAELYHVHLPALQEAGLVEWRPDEGLVAPGPRLPDADPLLDAARQVEPVTSG